MSDDNTCPIHGCKLVGDPPTVSIDLLTGDRVYDPGGRPPFCARCGCVPLREPFRHLDVVEPASDVRLRELASLNACNIAPETQAALLELLRYRHECACL